MSVLLSSIIGLLSISLKPFIYNNMRKSSPFLPKGQKAEIHSFSSHLSIYLSA
jgi:hypothetical protein